MPKAGCPWAARDFTLFDDIVATPFSPARAVYVAWCIWRQASFALLHCWHRGWAGGRRCIVISAELVKLSFKVEIVRRGLAFLGGAEVSSISHGVLVTVLPLVLQVGFFWAWGCRGFWGEARCCCCEASWCILWA